MRLWSMWSVWLVFRDCGFHSVCPLMDNNEAYGSFLMGNPLRFYSSMFCIVTQMPGPAAAWWRLHEGLKVEPWISSGPEATPILLNLSQCWLLPECLTSIHASHIPVAGGLGVASCFASLPSHHIWLEHPGVSSQDTQASASLMLVFRPGASLQS